MRKEPNQTYLNAKALSASWHLMLASWTYSIFSRENIDLICVQLHTYYRSEQELKYHNTGNPIYPTPLLAQDMTQGQFFKRSLTGLNSEISFS